MPDFEAMYFKLAAKTADTIETLDILSRSLKSVQLETEEMYIMDENDSPCDEE